MLMLNLLCLSISAQEKKASEKSCNLTASEIVDSLKKNSYAIMLVREATHMRDTLQKMCNDSTAILAHQDTISHFQGRLAEFPADSLLQKKKEELETLRDSLNSRLSDAQEKKHKKLTVKLSACQEDLASLMDTLSQMDSLKQEIHLWESRLGDVLHEKEAMEADLRLLTERKGLMDTSVVRIAFDIIEKPYNEPNVNETIAQFELIHPDLKAELSELFTLLKKYGAFYDEYRGMLIELQYDGARNVYETVAYSNKWTTKVKNLSYYKAYYSKGWNIPYLDARYKKILSRLEANRKATKTSQLADFTDLIYE